MKLLYLFVFLLLCSGLWCQFQWQDGGVPVNVNYPLYWYKDGGNVIGDISYFVWSESFSGNPDLYVQGYDSNGNQIWDEHHLVCNAPKYQGRGQVIGSDDDNIIVAWQDTRNMPGMYYGDGYEFYLQKISPEGENLWENELLLPQICHSYQPTLLSDNFGGCYVIYNAIGFHVSCNGEIIPGWETGLQIGEYYSYGHIVDSDGSLVVITTEEGYCYLTKYSALGEIIWDHILLADIPFFPSSVLENDNSIILFSTSSHSLYMQKISETGEIWDDPILIFEGESNVIDLHSSTYSNGIYLMFSEYSITEYIYMNLSFEGDIIWNNPLANNQIDGIHTAANDNLRYWEISAEGFTLWENDSEGNLVSPSEGWFHLDLPDYYWSQVIDIFDNENQTTLGIRQSSQDSEDEVLSFHIIDQDGVNVCGEDVIQISAGTNDRQQLKEIYKIDDLEIVLLSAYDNTCEKVYMKLFDEEGNQIGEEMLISHENARHTNPVKVINNRLYLAGEFSQESEEYLCLNAVEFDDEPYLVWEDEGLFLGQGEFINNEISLEELPEEENSLLCSWCIDSPYGETYLQKITDDQLAWQSGGINFPCQNGQVHNVRAYNDFILQVTSWGNGFYLNRVDGEGEPIWNNDIPLIWDSLYGFNAKILADGTLLMLRGEYMENGLALIENRIMPDGTNISGSMGDVVAFLNEAEYNFSIEFLDENYIVTAQDDDQQIYFWRFDYSGGQIGEITALPNPQNESLTRYEVIDGNIAYFTQGNYGTLDLHLADFDGTPNQILPQNPFQLVTMNNYSNNASFCKEDNDLYFCWMEGYSSERPDEGEYGWSWYMQKLTIPTISIHEDEITPSLVMEVYPNPFNPDLNISWNIDNYDANNVEISVYNTKGQKVQNWNKTTAKGTLTWNGENKNGNACSSGLYYIKINTSTESAISKTVLLK